MSSCDWLPPEFFSESIPKARKEYWCCECGKKIRSGMLYWNCVGKWDGDLQTYRQHIECRDACFQVQIEGGECIAFEGLREFMSENQCWNGWRESQSEMHKKQRSLLAAGIWASRLKTKEQIERYNLKHFSRRKHVT